MCPRTRCMVWSIDASAAAHEPADGAHQLLGALLHRTLTGAADHAMTRVVVEEPEGDLVERGLDGGDLRQHVHAGAVLLDHPLDAADLPLHPPQTLAELVLRGGVAARRRGHGVSGGHASMVPPGAIGRTRATASRPRTPASRRPRSRRSAAP